MMPAPKYLWRDDRRVVRDPHWPRVPASQSSRIFSVPVVLGGRGPARSAQRRALQISRKNVRLLLAQRFDVAIEGKFRNEQA